MMFGYVSKREYEALKADNARQRDTIVSLETKVTTRNREITRLTNALAEARAKQPQRGDKGRFVGVGK